MSTDAERLFKQENLRPEDLLTDGPNNRLNQGINTEETTIGNTKGGKKTGAKTTTTIRVRRTMVVTNHEDVLRLFLPIIAFGGCFLLFLQSLLTAALVLTKSPVQQEY
ncbi:unnamed protein product [Caenorhabditis brenneri]